MRTVLQRNYSRNLFRKSFTPSLFDETTSNNPLVNSSSYEWQDDARGMALAQVHGVPGYDRVSVPAQGLAGVSG